MIVSITILAASNVFPSTKVTVTITVTVFPLLYPPCPSCPNAPPYPSTGILPLHPPSPPPRVRAGPCDYPTPPAVSPQFPSGESSRYSFLAIYSRRPSQDSKTPLQQYNIIRRSRTSIPNTRDQNLRQRIQKLLPAW